MFELGVLTLIFAASILLVGRLLAKLPYNRTAANLAPEPKSGFLYSNSDIKVSNNNIRNHKSTRTEKPLPNEDQFVQTMGATFAQLKVGLAVFDRQNELSLFNPALTQHLGLRPEWLLKKPNLLGFLDRLRDTHILPEPKNYISWRRSFMKIKRSAMKDDYREDWDLPDGRALRVIGRPHLSGSVVFLFEDVTATLAMEREFRSMITSLKNTMNAATVGFVVFNRNGCVTFQNETLKRSMGKHSHFKTAQEFSRSMEHIFHPSPTWGDFRQYIEDLTERSSWQAEIETKKRGLRSG